MVVATDRSTLMAQFKCGTKGIADIDRKFNRSEDIPVNYMYGYDMVTALKEKSLNSINPSISPKSARNLIPILEGENTKPFFLFIRNLDQLYRAQMIQSLRNFCRKFTIFDESITLSGGDISRKDSLFKLFQELYPTFLTRVYSDIHYIRYTFDEALIFIQYIEQHRKDIFDNLFIIDLDNYSKTQQSLDLLNDYKVIDKTYFKEKSWSHSTKTLYMPEILTPHKVDSIYKVPYEKNKHALNLIQTLYKDRMYTYERLRDYKGPSI